MRMRKLQIKRGTRQQIPEALRAFAWNIGGKLTETGKKEIALNVIERGRGWHWTQLPKGWFDLAFCLEHGQQKTKQALREMFLVK